MGTYIHTATIVWSYDESQMRQAYAQALRLVQEELVADYDDDIGVRLDARIGGLSRGANGLQSFIFFPSGGKLGGSIETRERTTVHKWKLFAGQLDRVHWAAVEFGECATRVKS